MSASEDPLGAGFVKSLSRPGGNMTGIIGMSVDLDAKRLEVLKEALPEAKRVAVITNPVLDGSLYEERMKTLHRRAGTLKLQLQIFETRSAAEIEPAFAQLGKMSVDALMVRADPQVIDANRPLIIALAAKQNLPAVYPWRFFPEMGGLMSYGTSIPGFHHRSATYVTRILRGAKPGDLPIEQPTKYELVLNLKTAKALGLEVPKAVVLRADEIIQ